MAGTSSTATLAGDGAAVAAPTMSRTVRYWLQTVAWTGIGMLLCALLYCVEKYGLQFKERGLPRMFFNPAEISMRIFGLPHFIVGLFFMLSARRMRTATGWLWFFGLLAMGLAFAWVFHTFGAHKNPMMLIAFYFYFLIHGFRDEAFFYKNYGDCPDDDRVRHNRLIFVLQVMLISLLFAFIMPTYLQFVDLYGQKLPTDDPVLNLFFPASLPFLTKFAIYLVPVLLFNGALFAWFSRAYPGGWRAIWQDHHPLLVVFLISTGIIFATLLVGPWTFNFVVLAHFVGWYFFALRKLDQIPPEKAAPASRPLAWMRTTPAGFRMLHLGLAVLVTLLIAVSVYAFGDEGWLSTIVGGPAFYYWTVIHVSLSFYPR